MKVTQAESVQSQRVTHLRGNCLSLVSGANTYSYGRATKVYEWQGAGFYSLALIFTSRHLLKLSIVLSHDEKEEAQALFLHLKQELLYFGDLHETWGVLRASEDFTCG